MVFNNVVQVLILSEKLHSVTSQFDRLRAIRFQDAINRVTPRRKLKSGIENVTEGSDSSNLQSRKVNNSEVREANENQAEPIRVQQQVLDDETRTLQVISTLVDFCKFLHSLRKFSVGEHVRCCSRN
ncbi:Syntaxin [Abeliophyllum distichum]|uniref:Syntaxin n=1 Tax=Abeliophyllum distichum TaxID=126358 RepID=A0ABD1SWL6_9LAMI